MKVGYCTNVHAGTSLDAVNQNLLTHAVQVREELLESDSDRSQPLPVGLWLSNEAVWGAPVFLGGLGFMAGWILLAIAGLQGGSTSPEENPPTTGADQ